MQTKLTRQEQKIFDLLLTGAIPKDIATKLNISHYTVLNHQKSIYRKLDIHNIKELLIKYAQTKEQADDRPIPQPVLPKTGYKTFLSKIAIAAAAIILAIVIPLSVMTLQTSSKTIDYSVISETNPLVISFKDNRPYPWRFDIYPEMYFYENESQTKQVKSN